VLARSAYLRYREALGKDIGSIPDGLYPGDYLKPVGEALAKGYGDKLKAMPDNIWLPIVRDKAIAMMMDEIKGDLAALHIKHDVFFSERSLIETGNNKVAETIDFLRTKGDVYEGRLPPPKGAPVEDYEDREQTLFGPPRMATTSTVRCSNQTAATLISALISPTTRTSSIAAFATWSMSGAPITAVMSNAFRRRSRLSPRVMPHST